MDNPATASTQKNFFQRHFPRFYNTITYLAAPFFPNADLRNQLVKEVIQKEALEREVASLDYDYNKAVEDVWRVNQELAQERTRSKLYLQQRDNFQEQGRDSSNRWQKAYQALEEAAGLQLEEAHAETATYQHRCLDLEQRLRDTPPTLKTFQQTLQSLERDRELSELLFPNDSDDFTYLAAAMKIYPPQTDTPLDPDLENAITDMLNHPKKSLCYQTATLQLAQKLQQQNFPETVMSLYTLLLNHPKTEDHIMESVRQHIGSTPTPATTLAYSTLSFYSNYCLGKQKLREYQQQPAEDILIEAIHHLTLAITQKPDELLSDFRMYIHEKDQLTPITQHAKTLRDQKNYTASQSIFQFLTFIEPDNHHHHYFLATIYEQTNQFENARTQYQHAGNGSSAKAGLLRVEQKLSHL